MIFTKIKPKGWAQPNLFEKKEKRKPKSLLNFWLQPSFETLNRSLKASLYWLIWFLIMIMMLNLIFLFSFFILFFFLLLLFFFFLFFLLRKTASINEIILDHTSLSSQPFSNSSLSWIGINNNPNLAHNHDLDDDRIINKFTIDSIINNNLAKSSFTSQNKNGIYNFVLVFVKQSQKKSHHKTHIKTNKFQQCFVLVDLILLICFNNN